MLGLLGSGRTLEEVLYMPVRHFCYPNGLRRDISPEAAETVREAGYETAVTTEAGINLHHADSFMSDTNPIGNRRH